jgi:DNA-binding beta-propeller fold protein YncE
MSRPQGRELDRRRFLLSLGAGAASVANPRPAAAAWSRGSRAEGLILGAGTHRYEWVRGWGALPAGMTYGSMHGGVAVDAQNHVYFSTDGDASILVFDADGKFVRSMGKEWKPDKPGDGTHELHLHREGGQEFLYLTSLFRHEFAKLTTTGEMVWVKGFPEASGLYKSKDEFKPTGIAAAPSGDVYVTDGYGRGYVHRYSPRGEYLSSWGGKSTEAREPGKFSTPHKIIVDSRGPEPSVLVTDRENHRLQWFTREGKHLKTLDGTEKDFLRRPAALSIRGTDVAIADLKGRVTILDRNDKLATQLGDSGQEKKQATNEIPSDQWVDGEFIAPHGVSFDAEGNLYVSEWALAGRVVKLARVTG